MGPVIRETSSDKDEALLFPRRPWNNDSLKSEILLEVLSYFNASESSNVLKRLESLWNSPCQRI